MKKTDAYASLGADRKRFMSWQIRTILITMAGYALFYFVRKNFSLAMPGLTAEYGISNTNFGWIIFAGSLVYGFSRFINGYVVDRIRGRIVMALGLLAGEAAMFHLFTHALFKALLFLGAGCIIHAVHSNEMSAMGGLRRYMPLTHLTFLVACLAIAGIWPLSGFFSKDEILTACFAFSPVMGWVMTAIAGLTAFYMFRLYYGIFWGKENKELHAEHTPHESPLTMTFPLMFLAVVTCGAGFIPFGHFISSNGESYSIHLDPSVTITSVVIAIISIAIATWMYKNAKQPVADSLAKQFKGLHKAAYNRFYIDDIYQFITHKIIFRCISTPIAWWDRHVVDGFFNFLAWATNTTSDEIRGLQSGQVQQYAYVFLCGALALILLLIL